MCLQKYKYYAKLCLPLLRKIKPLFTNTMKKFTTTAANKQKTSCRAIRKRFSL